MSLMRDMPGKSSIKDMCSIGTCAIMSPMKDTTPRNPDQVGRAIRLKRQEKGLSQEALAKQVGVGRKWIMHLEAGNPKAELGLVLRALDALELQASLSEQGSASKPKANRPGKLDEVLSRLQQPRK